MHDCASIFLEEIMVSSIVKQEILEIEDLFDRDFYLAKNPDVAAAGMDPVKHYVLYGWKEGRNPAPWFSARYYVDNNKDMLDDSVNPLLHYKNFGRKKKLKTINDKEEKKNIIGSEFEEGFYLLKNKDVAKSKTTSALDHYIDYGWREGRNPTQWFSSSFYKRNNLDVAKSNSDPFYHYLKYGQFENRLPKEGFFNITNDDKNLVLSLGFKDFGFLRFFDHDFYSAFYMNSEEPGDRQSCISDFLLKGIKNLNSIRYGFDFDAVFYAQELNFGHSKSKKRILPDLSEKNALYEDFIGYGINNGLFPNPQSMLFEVYGIKADKRILERFSLSSDDDRIAGICFSGKLENFMEGSNPELLSDIDFENIENVLFLENSYRLSNSTNFRDRCIEILMVYLLETGDEKITHSKRRISSLIADYLKDKDNVFLAKHYYTKCIEGNSRNYWNYINFYNICLSINELDISEELRKGERYFSDNYHFIELYERVLNSIIQKRIKSYFNTEKLEDFSELRSLFDVLSAKSSATTATRNTNRIAIVGDHHIYQCKFYRIFQKAEHCALAGYSVDVFDVHNDLTSYVEKIEDYQSVVFYRVASFPDVIEAIKKSSELGLLTFYDIDDLIFDESAFPPPYETYDGHITEKQHLNLVRSVPMMSYAASLCQYGIASTEPLKRELEKYVSSGTAYVHRNALSIAHKEAIDKFTVVKRYDAEQVDIFYGSGTKAHKKDLREVLPVFKQLIDEFGNRINFRIVGHVDEDLFGGYEEYFSIIDPIWDIYSFWEMLSSADINLSILDNSLFNDCKSEIKWMEAAMFAIPSIVSSSKNYEDVIEHGRTGYLFNSNQELYEYCKILIEDPQKRKEVGENALRLVSEEYSLQHSADNIKSIISRNLPKARTSKIKCLIVNVFYPPQAIGGATRVVHDNVRCFLENYSDVLEVSIVCSRDAGGKPYSIDSYVIDTVHVYSILCPHGDSGWEFETYNGQVGIAFRSILDKIKPDIVHFHCIQRLTCSIVFETDMKKIPYIMTAHDSWCFSDNQFLINEHGVVETYDYSSPLIYQTGRMKDLRKVLFNADVITSVSEDFNSFLVDSGIHDPIVVENGVSDITVVPRVSQNYDKVRIAHIGGNSFHKGINLVRRAFLSDHFENIELTVIDHSFQNGQEEFHSWGSNRVHFRAKFKQEDIAILYSEYDIIVAPSIWPESYGLVTREATISGCWVITSNMGAIGNDIVDGENGFIVDVKSVDSLASALNVVNSNPGKFKKPPEYTGKIRHHSEQADELASLYKSIVHARKSENPA